MVGTRWPSRSFPTQTFMKTEDMSLNVYISFGITLVSSITFLLYFISADRDDFSHWFKCWVMWPSTQVFLPGLWKMTRYENVCFWRWHSWLLDFVFGYWSLGSAFLGKELVFQFPPASIQQFTYWDLSPLWINTSIKTAVITPKKECSVTNCRLNILLSFLLPLFFKNICIGSEW